VIFASKIRFGEHPRGQLHRGNDIRGVIDPAEKIFTVSLT
jgi:hypothetical protein